MVTSCFSFVEDPVLKLLAVTLWISLSTLQHKKKSYLTVDEVMTFILHNKFIDSQIFKQMMSTGFIADYFVPCKISIFAMKDVQIYINLKKICYTFS